MDELTEQLIDQVVEGQDPREVLEAGVPLRKRAAGSAFSGGGKSIKGVLQSLDAMGLDVSKHDAGDHTFKLDSAQKTELIKRLKKAGYELAGSKHGESQYRKSDGSRAATFFIRKGSGRVIS